MKFRSPIPMLLSWALLIWASAGGASAAEPLTVLYAFPNNYKPVMTAIARQFEADNPGAAVRYLAPTADYGEALTQVLRGASVGDVPDVVFAGIDQIRLLSDGHAVALDAFGGSAAAWEAMGYPAFIRAIGTVNGRIWGIPFAISTPILYVNADLVAAAGGSVDAMADDWEGLAMLGRRISALGGPIRGLAFMYDAGGNSLLQALLASRGGRFASPDGCRIGFDGPVGLWALRTLAMLHAAGLPLMSYGEVRQAFMAGTIGIYAASSSWVSVAEQTINGRFRFRTLPFPLGEGGRVPAGGSIAVMLTHDPARQALAWAFIRTATGPEMQTEMVRTTGYSPVNEQALAPALLGRFFDEHPNHRAAAEQLRRLTDWQSFAGPNSLKIVDVIQDQVVDIVSGRTAPEQAMTAMVSGVRRLLPPECGQP